jgi:hypothetical protein
METSSEPTLYCRRCDAQVEVIRPWRGWKAALIVWYGVMCVVVVLSPMMAADYCVMIPTMMAIILAGSPLHRLAKEKPVCRTCSLEIVEEKGGTARRGKPLHRAPGDERGVRE